MEERNSGKGMFAFGTLLIGIVLGAAAVILSDKETKKRFEDKFDDLKDEGEDLVGEAKDRMKEIKEEANKKVEKIRENTQKEITKLRKDAASRISGDKRG